VFIKKTIQNFICSGGVSLGAKKKGGEKEKIILETG
jgi:hypothetical protein